MSAASAGSLPMASVQPNELNLPSGLREGLILLGIASLAAGGLSEPIEPNRIILGSAMIFCLFVPRRIGSLAPAVRGFILLCLFWITWGFTSVLWAADRYIAFRDSCLLILEASSALGIALLARKQSLHYLRLGWALAVSATFPIAIWELLTGNHLALTSFGQGTTDEVPGLVIHFASATFGYRNGYGLFLCVATPFLLWGMEESKGLRRYGYLGVALSAAALIVLTGSRAGMGSLVLQVVLWVMLRKSRKAKIALVTFVFCIATAGLYLIESSAYGLYFKFRYVEQLSSRVVGSDSRVILLQLGNQMVESTYGVGVGAGNFMAIAEKLQPQGLMGVYPPHNYAMEIASQYGLLVLAAVFSWYLFCGFSFWRYYKRSQRFRLGGTADYRAGMISLLGLAPASVMTGTMIHSGAVWITLGCLMAILQVGWDQIRELERGDGV